ncbi:MAG: hypothetical protein HFF84_08465 [Oscillibacter sp.]|nr:hypothetical protein [Oscillibacter sp.]
MHEWIAVKTQTDIETLLQHFGGFHDSCLVSLSYQSGASVDSKQAMSFGGPEQRELHMLFHSQWEKRPLELCFTGVRLFHIAGYQERYSCDIFDSYLKIHTDLIPGQDCPLVVWADWENFSPKDAFDCRVLHEPMISYVIASALKWKFF